MLSGLIVRHLVMPLGVNDSIAVLKWFRRELPETASGISIASAMITAWKNGFLPQT